MVVDRAFDVRERAMSYAVQTAELGEDPLKILARAELYAEFILSPDSLGNVRKLTDDIPLMEVEAGKLSPDVP